MNKEIRTYHKHAIESILKAFDEDMHFVKVVISECLGKSAVIALLIEQLIFKNKSVLVLCRFSDQVNQMRYMIKRNYQILSKEVKVETINRFCKYKENFNNFDVIIYYEVDSLIKEVDEYFAEKRQKYIVGFVSEQQELTLNVFDYAKTVFKYTNSDAVNDGYLMYYNEQMVLDEVITPILTAQGFTNIKNESRISEHCVPDIVAKKDNKTYIIEVKIYRDIRVSSHNIVHALKQVENNKKILNKNSEYVHGIIMMCDIDETVKMNLCNENDIFLWDIKNLLYFCDENEELVDSLLKRIPYPVNSIEPIKPLNYLSVEKKLNNKNINRKSEFVDFERMLEECKSGKKYATNYEKLCSDIIRYLFPTEFSQIVEQSVTGDEMFRMDMLCALKGGTAFWRFLMDFYSTKFVVFEYKNYNKKISQNLIYITEKYLYSAALRNIAFIISRKGFDKNAYNASMGILKETGKFIISLTDEDLIEMIKIKKTGGEPSDYLLDKTEKILMSISK